MTSRFTTSRQAACWGVATLALALGACASTTSQLERAQTDDVASGEGSLGHKSDRRPNILLIVADDLGYSDLGAFGGEIHTPNLDRLAASGRLLTDHHTAATCSPTRSALISGTDHHLVGLGSMAELLQPEQQGKPGYEGYLNDKALSIAQLLQDSGYHTYTAGKWHLGLTEDKSPKAWGFEKSFSLAQGASGHFAPDPARPTSADVNAVWRKDGVETKVPEDFFSTNFYTDQLLSYLAANEGDGKPFFVFAAYTAPHWPLQAPEDFIDRYRGVYDAGYDVIRQRRIARQKELGVIPRELAAADPLPSTEENPSWDALTPEQKKLEARRMEIYAAMVENLDHNVGRLLAYLEQSGQREDTFVFFQSDNGAEGSPGFDDTEANDNRYENFGRRYSNVSYGRRWGEVSAAPFRLWKAYSTEGGVSVPAIASLPRHPLPREPFRAVSHVSDLAPTFLALAKAPDPGASYRGREVHPITGRSLLGALRGHAERVHPEGAVIADELFGRRYVRRDRWKLVWNEPPYGSGEWALFDLKSDRAERRDLSKERPEIAASLRAEWDAYVTRVGVVLPLNPGVRK